LHADLAADADSRDHAAHRHQVRLVTVEWTGRGPIGSLTWLRRVPAACRRLRFCHAYDLLHGIRGLRTLADPVMDAVEGDAEFRLVLGGFRVVEPDALDEAPVTGHAGVGDDDAVERAVLGSASRHANHDHFDGSFPLRTGNE